MSSVPAIDWQSLAARLRADIGAGVYPVGSQLPSEPELMAQLGAGRHSLRRALGELAAAGLIRTAHGKGSFVQRADVIDYRIALRTRASRSLAAQGRNSTDEPVREATLEAPPEIAEALRIAEGEPVYMIVRHGFADGMPISISTAWHPVKRFPGIDKVRRGRLRLTEIYASYGVHDYFRLKTTISAGMPSAETARVLRLAAQQPVLVTHKIDADMRGVPIAYSEVEWAADRIRFVVDNMLEIDRMTADPSRGGAKHAARPRH